MTRRPVLAAWIACALTVSAGLATSPVPAAAAPAVAATNAAATNAAAAPTGGLAACGKPRLAPALAPAHGKSPSLRGTGSLPARGQAIVLMVMQHLDSADELRVGSQPQQDPRRLAKKLTTISGWQSLPPEIVAHRLLGTPDPYAFEGAWPTAVKALAKATASKPARVSASLESGARASQRCAPQPGRSYPLPVGSGFEMLQLVSSGQDPAVAAQGAKQQGAKQQGTKQPGKKRQGAKDPKPEDRLLFGAPCGLPVRAASAGTVRIDRDDRQAGPWAITISRGELSSTYRHVTKPLVRTGEKVSAGQPIATVGDLGYIDRCALGFTLRVGKATLKTNEVATWLAPKPQKAKPPRNLVTDRQGVDTGATTTFRITTFNVLGAHLTGPGSDRPSYGPGPGRMAAAMGRLNAAGSSIVLLQEFESPQAAVVASTPGWQLHRATGNSTFRGGNYSGNAIAFRPDTWRLLSTSEFTVPWQVRLHMPVLYLQHLDTGAVVAVIAVHNPASTAKQGNQSRSRGIARSIEKQTVASILRDAGIPVLLGGDMNERSEAICDFVGSGLRTYGSGCRGYGGVDHIFGAGAVAFNDLSVDRGTLGGISDHPMVTATVTINP